MTSTSALSANKLFDLTGWTALVTGGGTGIGLMCSQALAANGAKVYITGRHIDSLENAAKQHSAPTGNGDAGKLIPMIVDVQSKESIQELYKQISQKEPKLHLLVNNAGIDGPTRSVEKAKDSADALTEELNKDTVQDWQDVYATNVIGAYFMSTTFLPLLHAATAAEYGFSASIVNITSISGITRTTQHHMPYNVSKAAAIQLTAMLAQEFSEPGVKVRVNSIAPGIFPSVMTTDEAGPDQKSHIDASNYREKKGIPAGRPGKDEDMAIALLSLATNQYMTGETVRVDGGYLMKKP